MDYTTVNRFLAELISQKTQSTLPSDNAVIASMITAASRMIDRYCTGVADPDATDYFKAETKTDEALSGQIDNKGSIFCFPHKPIISSVSAFSYRLGVRDPWLSVDPAYIVCNGPMATAYPSPLPLAYPTRCFVKMTYAGGLAATTTALPKDLIDLATLLAIRLYREAETGLTDAIGVAELGTLVYTKAWPVRVTEGLKAYKRYAGWRFVS